MKSRGEPSDTAPRDADIERSWMILERVIRSTAHSVGNAINVVSGRLSLLELDSALGDEGLEAIQLVRERLRRTHAELKGAVAFAYAGRAGASGDNVLGPLQALSRTRPIDGIELEPQRAYISRVDVTLPLKTLAQADEAVGAAPGWQVTEGPTGLMLTVACNPRIVPADRRLALEPWFEEGASESDESHRYARLLLAIALGRLEEGGATIAVRTQETECGKTTAVSITWPT